MTIKKLPHKKKKRRPARELYGGIDPGTKGWMTVYNGRKIVYEDKLPWLDREPDLTDLVRYFYRWKLKGVQFVYIEEQAPFGKDTAVTSFSLGAGYWALQAILTTLKIPYATITSTAWRKELGIKKPSARRGKKKVNPTTIKKKIKARSIAAAQKLAPGHDFRTSDKWNSVPNDNKAEAFLLSVVAYRRHGRA